MGDKKFNYGKAEADLYDAGCPDSEEIYGYRSEKAIESFMRENGLDPEKYYDNTEDSKSSSSNNNSSGCYLTSACVNAKGLPDDCEELTVLRNFRDGGTEHTVNYARKKNCFIDIITDSE